MGERKMEFDSVAGPRPSLRAERENLRLLRILNDALVISERREVSETIEALSNIVHELDADCDCDTCTKVREIAESHGG